jgi:soluble lytic murein transglycosylase-like protein
MIRQLDYLWTLSRSVFIPVRPAIEQRRTVLLVTAGLMMLVLITAAVRSPATALGSELRRAELSNTEQLLERTRLLDASLRQVQLMYREEIEPLERVLLYYNKDQRLVRRVASALVAEGRRTEIASDLLLAVLLVENPDLNPNARSIVGARGLMQVMPFHAGNWRACSGSLDSIEGNICYGAQIFRDNLRATGGNFDKALLRYNGCVRGTNTPDCYEYPNHVFARVGRAMFLTRQSLTRTSP